MLQKVMNNIKKGFEKEGNKMKSRKTPEKKEAMFVNVLCMCLPYFPLKEAR